MNLPGWITLIKESGSPLSCHCFIIKGSEATWIYDVGAGEEAFAAINGIGGRKNIVLSHFHQDHTLNMCRLNADEIYQGRLTFRHTKKGSITEETTVADDGYIFRIFPLPNTHAKGSLGLEVNGYAFLGDAAYPAEKEGRTCYNATLLQDEIKILKACNADYFVMGHGSNFVYEKDRIIAKLETILSQRKPREAYITVDDISF